MNAPRRLVLSALFACLFVLVLVGVSALLMFASEAGPEGGGRAPEERLVALFAVVAVACATVCAVVYRLYALYVAAPLRLAEELAATSAHSGLRVGEHGASEVRVLGQAANQVLAVRDALERDVAERIREARASLEEERSRLAALMADLSQSVVVCNLDGRVLLYNQRAKQELSSGPDGTNAELLGLGRSIHTVFDRALIEHALERLQQASRERASGAAASESRKLIGSAQFVTATRAGRLVRAHMTPVLGSNGQHTAQVGDLSVTGFVLVLDDVTNTNERHARRDALIQSLIEGGRGPLGSIRAAAEMLSDVPDMLPAQRDRFLGVIRDEAKALSLQFESAASAFSNDLRERWLLEEILGAELIAVAARRISEARPGEPHPLAVKSENVDEDLWLRVDSFGLLQALRYLALRLQDEYQVREVRLWLTRSGQLAQLDLSWPGTFMNNETAMSWLQDPMTIGGETSPLSVTDVVERCNGDIWFQRERVSHRAFFRTMLPAAEAPKDLPRAIVAASEEERPEFYDFDLFSWSTAGHELDDRPLAELSYTVFDTETTGLQPSMGDEIIQIGATRIVNRRLLRHECFDQLINPHRELSRQSIEIHGITQDVLADQPPVEVALPKFHAFCADTVLVGHNAAFDMRFLQLKEKKTGIRFDQPVLDTLLLSAVLHPNQASHRLEAIAERLGVSVFGRHTALGDALVTGEVFLKMLPLLAEIGITTLRQAREASERTFHARLKY
ncbi:MAG TPA: exonuclease domain-containing protein [Accumulibacter sp.]|uniref:3'-5' exonuclease n=3 Tax=Accumulibacter sp. TaxID=2053492 RepID=UPI00260A0E3D|nr:exonuclease domain-containing protein [Accumulibacter sp.]MDS4056480.1 exonuclease domain-containing protein [Accumulibacter sp.]HMV05123.1 exonuclease domain-containing protein [Accumulibacter sp.]HMW79152.1 exonuclease domain-containing protein [Accumulibacter sp.]HMX68935.1 exonuclease domain-containing protein [Accumulibacter sp.]HNB68335.1 exonuclease domain-containing protein [Accumulibacter sp.]